MKRIVLAGLTALSLGLWGCNLLDLMNVPGRECPDPGSKGTMTATTAGEAFEACNTTISGAPNSSYVITGLSGDAVPDQIVITVVASEGPGTYAFGGASGNGDTNGVFIDSSEVVESSEEAGSYVTKDDVESGSITFTTLDATKAAGTFTFTGYRKSDGTTAKEVTDGAFDVEF